MTDLTLSQISKVFLIDPQACATDVARVLGTPAGLKHLRRQVEAGTVSFQYRNDTLAVALLEAGAKVENTEAIVAEVTERAQTDLGLSSAINQIAEQARVAPDHAVSWYLTQMQPRRQRGLADQALLRIPHRGRRLAAMFAPIALGFVLTVVLMSQGADTGGAPATAQAAEQQADDRSLAAREFYERSLPEYSERGLPALEDMDLPGAKANPGYRPQ